MYEGSVILLIFQVKYNNNFLGNIYSSMNSQGKYVVILEMFEFQPLIYIEKFNISKRIFLLTPFKQTHLLYYVQQNRHSVRLYFL